MHFFCRLGYTGLEQGNKAVWLNAVFVKDPALYGRDKSIGKEVYIELVNILLAEELPHVLGLNGQKHFAEMFTE